MKLSPDLAVLLRRFQAGDRRALARLITLVENREPGVPAVMRELYGHTGRACIVGITGPPGAGKSTLCDKLIGELRRDGRRVGVVAVDPSSPFSGGAVLGDRVRMQAHFLDDGVFIRSLATRGRHGGLARCTREVVHLLDAFGCDVILVETVGVGQTELDIMALANTTVVVLVPEAGDTIQVMKAGLLEIADVFVVNKADRDGAARLRNELEAMVHMRAPGGWSVPVLCTEATNGRGVSELLQKVFEHEALVRKGPSASSPRRDRVGEMQDIIRDVLLVRIDRALEGAACEDAIRRVQSGECDPYSAALAVLEDEQRIARFVAAKAEGA